MTVSLSTTHRLHIPIIDISGLDTLISATGEKFADRYTDAQAAIAAQIGQACREYGFFYITGHGIDETLQQRLEQLSRQFFAQDLNTKMEIEMERGGRAWRGYFPVGGELTSGKPDLKEGIYFGAELDPHHPLVQAGVPLHGANLFPANLPELREVVLSYMAAMTRLGHTLMAGMSLSLGLEPSYFSDRYTTDPLILFRIFNYPSEASATSTAQWGVGEHTDYGILTILKQDQNGGLQIKSQSQWIDAPPLPNTFVCNIGDMLERMTGGLYRSTPHRVKNSSGRDRLSFPFFFDPNFNVEVKPIAEIHTDASTEPDQAERWDKANVHTFQGTYGDYVLGKVSKVFPILRRTVL
jgi:isopenicillin N synthase-like dioxygenase